MTPLPTTPGGFGCLVVDPPWRFASNSRARPGRNAMRHYACMTVDEIALMPVREVAAPESVLFLWITGPFLAIGAHMPIMKAWGFKPSSIAFVWNKGISGTGFTTRKQCEFVVLGSRGRSMRKAKDVRDYVEEIRREHSRKPDEVYRRIERYCDGPYLELFGRQSRPGWTVYGDEATKFDVAAE